MYTSPDSRVVDFRFSQSAVYNQYARTVYNILDVLTTLGGLFSSLSLVGMAFTKIFSYNLMLSSLIRKLYHFKPRFESEIKKKKKKKGGKGKGGASQDNDKGAGGGADGKKSALVMDNADDSNLQYIGKYTPLH